MTSFFILPVSLKVGKLNMDLYTEMTAPKIIKPESAVTKQTSAWAEVDEEGRLILPPGVAANYGLKPGAKVRLDEGENFVRMHRPVTHLTKVYIEPTVACNLDCITCFRNGWDQPMGRMSEETFAGILEGLKGLDPIPSVYFGGIEEPLFHQKRLTG